MKDILRREGGKEVRDLEQYKEKTFGEHKREPIQEISESESKRTQNPIRSGR